MLIKNNGSTYVYQHNSNNRKKSDFTQLLDMAINKPKGTQVKLTADNTSTDAADNVEDSVIFGILQHYEADNMPEPVTSLSLVPPPKYPKSIYDIPLSEIIDEIHAASSTVRYMVEEGMSRYEIFKLTKETFMSYLGKDFLTLQESQYKAATDGFYKHNSSDRDLAVAGFSFSLQEHGLTDIITDFWNNYHPNKGDMMSQLEMQARLSGR